MRKGQLIILCLLIIALVSIILWNVEAQGKINNMIQAGAIIALVFLTLFYAIQTQELVEKQEKSIKEERKRRDAEFADKKLQEFFTPMIYKLVLLEITVKDIKSLAELESSISEIRRIIKEMGELMKKYMYLLSEKNISDFANIEAMRNKAILLRDEKKFPNWKEDSISVLDEFTSGFLKKHKTFMIRLSEGLRVHDKKAIEKWKSGLIENVEK